MGCVDRIIDNRSMYIPRLCEFEEYQPARLERAAFGLALRSTLSHG